MSTDAKIRLLVVDDHEAVRHGVRALLEGTGIDVVAEAASGKAAAAYVCENQVDVVLMDIRMPDGDGLTALGRIKLDKPDLPVLLFTAHENPADLARAVAMGASGSLLKDCTRERLIDTIRRAASGDSVWTEDELRSLSGALRTPRLGGDLDVCLSDREGQVLRQIASGMTNKQIAESLNIGCETVKEHIQHIFRKLGLTDRTQAAVWAVRKDLV